MIRGSVKVGVLWNLSLRFLRFGADHLALRNWCHGTSAPRCVLCQLLERSGVLAPKCFDVDALALRRSGVERFWLRYIPKLLRFFFTNWMLGKIVSMCAYNYFFLEKLQFFLNHSTDAQVRWLQNCRVALIGWWIGKIWFVTRVFLYHLQVLKEVIRCISDAH